jgi:hypothetical protein
MRWQLPVGDHTDAPHHSLDHRGIARGSPPAATSSTQEQKSLEGSKTMTTKTHAFVGLLRIMTSLLRRASPDPATAAAAQGKDQLLALIDAESNPAQKKDEFETTAQFEQRQRQSVGKDFLVSVPVAND